MPTLDLTQGAAREPVAAADVQRLRAARVLVDDPRRERPIWFDGLFLTARHLIREQQYMLTREADLGRAAGSGVAVGLHVDPGSNSYSLAVGAGHGLTPAGELVLLPRRVEVPLANIAQAEQLSARFGLGRLPVPPLRSRTGLFVLALRPVEYTANPVGAYPSSLTGQRTVEDGDTIEATAVILVPWPDDGASDDFAARRGRIAHGVFVAGAERTLSANVLPLALVAVRNNVVEWIDEPMVRRELGADRGDLPGLGFSPRALRLAHLLQHQEHLGDVLAHLRAGTTFPAVAWFPALPSAGPLPPNVIDIRDFTQGYFPAEVDVDFAPIPDDELPALIEDALALPPIDLQSPAEALDSTGVLIVAPVPRNEWRAVIARLNSTSRLIKPAAPNLLARRKPFELLQRLRLPQGLPQPADPTSPSDADWQRLARLPNLWFVRRRQIAARDDYTGAWSVVTGVDERTVEEGVRVRLADLGLADDFARLTARATPAAASLITGLLASPRLAESPALTAAAIGALAEAARHAAPATPRDLAGVASASGGAAAATPTLDLASALQVHAELAAPGAGAGLQRIEQQAAGGALRADTLRRIAASAEWRRADAAAVRAEPAQLHRLARSFDHAGTTAAAPAAPAREDAPAATPLAEPVAGPVAESVAEPVAGPVAEPVAGSVAQPVAEPMAADDGFAAAPAAAGESPAASSRRAQRAAKKEAVARTRAGRPGGPKTGE